MTSYNNRFRPLYLLVGAFLVIQMALRITLGVVSFHEIDHSAWEWIKIYASGLFFDLLAATYLATPFILYLMLAPTRWLQTKGHRFLVYLGLFATLYFFVFVAFAEYIFWEEFSTRFNFIVVDYLIYTQEVVGNIKESYPLPILLGLMFVVASFFFVLLLGAVNKCLRHTSQNSNYFLQGAFLLALVGLIFFTPSPAIPPPLSTNSYHNELGSNGIYNFCHAFWHNHLNYKKIYLSIDETEAFTTVRKLLQSKNSTYNTETPTDLGRKIIQPGEEKPLNIVILVVESLSASFCGDFGNQKGLTPYLDKLSNESLLFTNLYATGTRTVRGLEAVTLSLPPLPGGSIVRHRTHDRLFSTGGILAEKGYKTKFIYGGFGYFDNMNAFFSHLGFTIIDRTAIPSQNITFSNIWGVCDEDLLNVCLQECAASYKAKQPSFSIVMTTSNHRPFTYPDGKIEIPSHSGRNGGVKYTDFAIGKFLEAAKKEPWFEETVFAIVADHCASSAGKADLPAWNYHIPLWIYSPKHIAPGRVNTLASQIDVVPTVLGLLNMSYETRLYGKNILDMQPEEERAFISNYQLVGLLKKELPKNHVPENNQLVILKPKQRHSA